MMQSVEVHVAPYPVDARLLGTDAVVLQADLVAHPIHQPGFWWRCGSDGGERRHGEAPWLCERAIACRILHVNWRAFLRHQRGRRVSRVKFTSTSSWAPHPYAICKSPDGSLRGPVQADDARPESGRPPSRAVARLQNGRTRRSLPDVAQARAGCDCRNQALFMNRVGRTT